MKTTNECIDFITSITSDIEHSGISLASHLLGVYSFLRLAKAPEYVCLAGLFHSIYGTEFYDADIKIDRTFVKVYIGKEAEELVFLFCHLRDRDISILKSGNKDLMFINYANLLEIYSQCKSEELMSMIRLYQTHLQR